MIPRYQHESQREYVERVLVTEGRISAWDCLYEGRYEDGSRFSITRLAASIWTLRHEAHLSIAENAGPGELATYTYHGDSRVPVWARGWRCTSCGASPASVPEVLLGGMGTATCDSCHARRTFRRSVAA